MKIAACSVCSEEVELKRVSATSNSYHSWCIACHNVKKKAYYDANRDKMNALTKQWREVNKPAVKIYNKQYYKNNSDKIKLSTKHYRETNIDKLKEYFKKHRETNACKIKQYYRKWRKVNLAQYSAYQKTRRRRCRQATPPWANPEAIRQIYLRAQQISKETGIQHHVDHIIPLKGKLVSGLHVESNLAILVGTENIRKSNQYLEG